MCGSFSIQSFTPSRRKLVLNFLQRFSGAWFWPSELFSFTFAWFFLAFPLPQDPGMRSRIWQYSARHRSKNKLSPVSFTQQDSGAQNRDGVYLADPQAQQNEHFHLDNFPSFVGCKSTSREFHAQGEAGPLRQSVWTKTWIGA